MAAPKNVVTLYRGESAYNKGGNFYTPDAEWAPHPRGTKSGQILTWSADRHFKSDRVPEWSAQHRFKSQSCFESLLRARSSERSAAQVQKCLIGSGVLWRTPRNEIGVPFNAISGTARARQKQNTGSPPIH
jgi:hypothetical protein